MVNLWFLVPDVGNFYTAPNGPNGTGTLVTAGTVFTTSQTLYFYADDCVDNRFDFIVHPLPLVDTLSDITTCLTYSLPTITNGNYFTEENGQGTQLNARRCNNNYTNYLYF